jgi:c-di-AMP phosphodiesterase-like protein
MGNNEGRFSSIFDYIFLGLFIFIGLSIIVGFYMLDTNPVLFFAVVIIFTFILIVTAILSNVFNTMDDNNNITTEAAKFNITSFIMNNLVIFVLGLGFIGIVVLFAKLKVGFFQ